MGLPLFVAPVETDLPHKTGAKPGILSPSRSAIRRSHRSDSREQRNAARRAAAVRIVGVSQPSLPPTSQDRQFPWPNSDLGVDPERPNADEQSLRPMREALRDMTSGDSRRRDRLEDQMSSIFGGTWHDVGPVPAQREDDRHEGDVGWWPLETRPRARRARVVAPVNSRYNRSPYRRRDYNTGTPPLHPLSDLLLERLERSQNGPSTSNDEGSRAPLSIPESRRRRNRQSRLLRTLSSGRSSSSRRAAPVDGLGDRDRSLSPEVWDTLLSTLTPDPQPPSVGSSFASVVASQSAGPTSNAPLSAPDVADVADETAADQACESGCENSDLEDPDYEHPDYSRIRERMRRRREVLRQHSHRIPDYNLDGPLEEMFSLRTESSDAQASSRTHRATDAPLLSSLRAQADAWAERLSAGASEDERGTDQSTQNREDSAGAAPSNHPGDVEWLGMQRIVRSLAAREDIPDEWWAEAGLSRTLPHDEST